jgi:hypothetical protein
MSIPPPTREIIKCDYAVEANGFEALTIWEKYHTRAKTYKQEMRGLMCDVAFVNGQPICVSLNWDVINGKRVLFYYGCSNLVDHKLVDAWVRENALSLGAHCENAMNFHIIFNYLE